MVDKARSESAVQNEIRLALSKAGVLNFRNNTGQAWQGSKTIRQPNGDLLIKNPRPVNFGLHKGSSDIIGLKPVTITEDMVGQTLGVFVAIEVKAGKGKPTVPQQVFLKCISEHGGLSGVVWNINEALEVVGSHGIK